MEVSDLVKLQKKVETAKQNIARLDGELQGVMKALKTEDRLNSIQEVKDKIAELELERQRISKEKGKAEKELEEIIEIEEEEE